MAASVGAGEARGRSGRGSAGLARTPARSVSPLMVRDVATAARRCSDRDGIASNQNKKKARKIRLFRNGDGFYKVRRSYVCVLGERSIVMSVFVCVYCMLPAYSAVQSLCNSRVK